MTYSLAQGFVVNNAITIDLEYAVGRERPNQESNTSFPSGHTSNLFTGAVIAGHYYGWKAYVPLCGLAIFVGLTRIEENAHWLSDVVAGAGLGCLVGHSVLHANGLHVHGDRVTWAPTFPRGGGVGVQIHVKL